MCGMTSLTWLVSVLEGNLDHVLLDDVPWWRRRDLHCWRPLAAELRERTEPGEGERPPECCLHGLPTWKSLPRGVLTLQTFNTLQQRAELSSMSQISPHNTLNSLTMYWMVANTLRHTAFVAKDAILNGCVPNHSLVYY